MKPLTPSERAVAIMLAQGMSNKEIARARGSGDGTIKVHVRAIYRKLGIHGRTRLTAMWAGSALEP